MARAFVVIGILGLVFGAPSPSPAADEAKTDPARLEFFEGKVRPVLANNCIGCHGPDKQKAGLRLDSKDALARGGDSGPVVKPGDPENSRLIEVIRYDADTQMPPKRKLKDAEIADLTEWIRLGAPWPESGQAVRPAAPATGPKVTAEDRAFWSFQPIRAVAPPEVLDAAWPKSPIDRFILAKLESKGLRPVGPADKRTLLRRVTFDLIGLPPTPEEVAAFLADDSPNAFARVIDRLLASPRYGERWGRHWLDVARYGEDQAHTFEARLYPFGYRYRDWVVKAFNDDIPYDRFILEQVAGDLLDGPGRDDRLAATGLFALGPVYYGKAVCDELDDRVDTLTRGFLGLTVACARCHDHKFDPISQRDYYALAGVFRSTEYKEYPKAPPEALARFEQGQAAIKAKTQEVDAFLRTESARWSESAAGRSARYIVAAWTLANRRKGDPKIATEEVAKADDLDPFFLDRWVKYLYSDEAAKRPHLARWNRLLAAQDRATDLSKDEAAKAEVAKVAEAFQEYAVTTLRLRDAIKQQRAAALANVAEGEKASAPAGPVLGDAESALLREVVSAEGLFGLPKNEVAKRLPDQAKKALAALRAELERLKKEAPAKPPVIHALTDGSNPGNMRVFLRGNPNTPGGEAPRRFLAVLSDEKAPAFATGSGRLELARTLAIANNPLTARVLVNRVWEHHFGRGLVGTPSNFGKLGERPTHPELLDWLAARFVASGGSIKALHREILLSATYQLGSEVDSSAQEVDADNTLLWRASRRRLEVEAWRDAMLAVSGELDPTLGGSSADLASPDNRRRTLYAAVSRHNLDSLLRLFDFPDPNITSDKRPVTSVPLQQLFVLNSAFMERRARALAGRLTANPDEATADRIGRAYSLLFGRPATGREVRLALDFLAGSDDSTPTRWERYAQALLGSNEFTFLD
jgi:cytochrome c553